LQSIKNLFGPVKENPLIAGGVGVVLLLAVGVLVAFAVLGGDDEAAGPGESATKKEEKKSEDEILKEIKKRKVKPAPVRRSPGTLDVSRSVGRLAIAQGRGRIKNPSGVSVRVSAAPKQTVTVDYQLSCYKATGKTSVTKVGQARYRTVPPNVRSIPLPLSGADECVVTVGAQLTRTVGEGRVKVAVVAG
jgi:hypothetical protein